MVIEKKLLVRCFVHACVVLILVAKSEGACSSFEDCKSCISSLEQCAWCEEQSLDKTGCFAKNDESSKCGNGTLHDPSSEYLKSYESYLSKNPYMEITPKNNTVRIRAGDTVDVELQVEVRSDQAVDFYYLTDISQSMHDDMESIKRVAASLGDNLRNLTSNLRVGFGTFIDKKILPYYDSFVIGDGGVSQHCDGAYGFCNAMALTNYDPDIFRDVIDKTSVMTNADEPEGGLDALLQVLKCHQIAWKNDSRKIVLFTTDQAFHYAGDGKLAGISKVNDGGCHYDEKTSSYSMSEAMDYPSIYQISEAAKEKGITVVFAVVDRMLPLYTKLSHKVPLSNATIIEKDSSNIMTVITQVVEDVTNQFTFEVPRQQDLPSELSISFTNTCPGENSKDGACHGLKIGDSANITAKLKLNKCPEDMANITFDIGSKQLNNYVSVTAFFLCDCDCKSSSREECSGHGDSVCGKCECDDGYFGSSCNCTQNSEESEQACKADGDGRVCAGRGECICGECHCDTLPSNSEYKYCSTNQCSTSDFSCGPTRDNLCNKHGQCRCGKCICDPDYKGDVCDCPQATDGCQSDGNGTLCSGNGECKCNKCNCDLKDGEFWFFGEHCEKCRTCSDLCHGGDGLLPCVKYQWRENIENFQVNEGNTDQYNQTCMYNDVEFVVLSADEISELEPNVSECEILDDREKCHKKYWYDHPSADEYIVYYTLDPAECSTTDRYIIIISAVLGTIIALIFIAVLAWFCYRCIKNKQEVDNYKKHLAADSQKVHSSPMYQNPVQVVENPWYQENSPHQTSDL